MPQASSLGVCIAADENAAGPPPIQQRMPSPSLETFGSSRPSHDSIMGCVSVHRADHLLEEMGKCNDECEGSTFASEQTAVLNGIHTVVSRVCKRKANLPPTLRLLSHVRVWPSTA